LSERQCAADGKPPLEKRTPGRSFAADRNNRIARAKARAPVDREIDSEAFRVAETRRAIVRLPRIDPARIRARSASTRLTIYASENASKGTAA